jgi:putative endonuclease
MGRRSDAIGNGERATTRTAGAEVEPVSTERAQTDTKARRRLGSGGERLGASWLAARGYEILALNWRCPYGELDVIAEREGELVFVEVKTRRGTSMGLPEEAITAGKRRKLIVAAQAYLEATDAGERPYRIDVVAVQLSPSGKLLEVRHHERAVWADE